MEALDIHVSLAGLVLTGLATAWVVSLLGDAVRMFETFIGGDSIV
jgi:hypothetical protein